MAVEVINDDNNLLQKNFTKQLDHCSIVVVISDFLSTKTKLKLCQRK